MDKRRITLNETEFVLGDKYRDKLLGNVGVATAGASYLTGCDQIRLLWNDSTGRPCAEWLDVINIENVEVKRRPGGPVHALPGRSVPGINSGGK